MTREFAAATAIALAALTATAAVAEDRKVCPPGEAIGNSDCVRPGVAKRIIDNVKDRREDLEYPVLHDLAVGKILDKDYAEFVDFERVGLPRPVAGVAYWKVGDFIVAVDRDDREVRRIFRLDGTPVE